MFGYGKTILLMILGLCIITCKMNMGLGEEVDLTAPAMTVTRVRLPNNKTHDITTDGNKLYVGPGIKEGFTLEGESSDNVRIERIEVEEIQKSVTAGAVPPSPPSWNNATIGGRNAEGIQEWSIYIDKIDKGEHILKITAYDHVGNTGPDSVKTLTLLIDTEDPFIENITIERPSGQRVSPLPRESLETMDENLFANIDYFQNESFIVHAAVVHDYPLSDVTLNLLYQGAGDNEEKPLFSSPLSRRPESSLYAPSWLITEDDLIKARPVLASGRHYLKIAVTATAAAGHSGTNLSWNLCWYPEMDIPRAEASKTDMNEGTIILRLGNQTTVSVSDDDNIGEVYAKMITKEEWDKIDGGDESAKLAWYEQETHYLALSKNLLETPVRNAVIAVESGKIHGEHRLVVLARDIGTKWTSRVYPAKVIEDGIPVITVISPEAGTSPILNDRAFTIKASVTDTSEVNSLTMAWIKDADMSIEDAKQALKANSDKIKVWKPVPGESKSSTINGKKYFEREFEQILKLDDFKVDNKPYMEAYRFILSARAVNGTDVFYPYSLLAHKTPPDIEIQAPSLKNNVMDTAHGANVDFIIKVTSPLGVPVKTVTLERENKPVQTLDSTGNNIFSGTVKMELNDGFYAIKVRAVDELNNERFMTITMNVSSWPELQIIKTDYTDTATFSSLDTVQIQAVFDKGFSLTLDKINNNDVKPTLTLAGIKNNGAAVTRYAEFTGGAGTETLTFEYKVQAGDFSDGLQITHLDMKQAQFAANWGGNQILSDTAYDIPPGFTPTANLPKIDAIAPKITGITITGDGDAWLMENQELKAAVSVNKEIQVLGSPVLLLRAGATVLKALYQSIDTDNKTMRFSYRVRVPKNTDKPVIYNTPVFEESSLAAITDKAGINGGNRLILDALPTLSGDITIDTTPPPPLNVQIDPTGFNTNIQKDFIIVQDAIEPNAQIEYTTDGYTWKNTWKTSPPPYTFSLEGDGVYQLAARQTDRAGNVSLPNKGLDVTLGENGELLSITADVPNGVYNQGKITFKLFFNGKIDNATLADAKLKIGHNNGQYANGNSIQQLDLMADADYSLKAEFDISSKHGLVWPELDVKSIDLADVKWINQQGNSVAVPTAKNDTVKTNFNTNSAITVLTKAPAITSSLPENGVDNAGLSPSGNESILTLNFSHEVWLEKGTITVKPASGWHIPPVLTNDEFSKIVNANPNEKTKLEQVYKRTTHGLKESGGYMVPDTGTRYVLDFSKGLDDSDTNIVANTVIKQHMTTAKFLWQEIDVTIPGKITGEGTTEIKVHLNKLPDGRKWEILIPAGTFCDKAGNPFTGTWETSKQENTFWSAQTAAPVIRVNRVSNNSHSTDPTDKTATATSPGTNVYYRIDCETPGAIIKYTTKEDLTATIDKNTSAGNSSTQDVRKNDLSALPLNSDYSPGSTLTIGDNSLYTARKDYIAATAKRDHLTQSVKGYEGAFKTVVVYRNVWFTFINNVHTLDIDAPGYQYVKFNGSNKNGSVPTIDGFPLNLSDVKTSDSKFAYRYNNGNLSCSRKDDFIWISWEIVSDFYQQGMKLVRDNDMTGRLKVGDDKSLNKRSYGNYSLKLFPDKTF